jgi:hypothetical protein
MLFFFFFRSLSLEDGSNPEIACLRHLTARVIVSLYPLTGVHVDISTQHQDAGQKVTD